MHVINNGDDVELRKDAGSAKPDELLIVKWRADVNADGALDLAVSFMGSAGNRGEYLWAILVHCGGGQHVTVWGPKYMYSIEEPQAGATSGGWRELVAVSLVEQADRSKHDHADKHTLRFNGGRYELVP